MCISTDPIFYVYVYLDPRKPGYYVYGNYIFEYEPFYVGKGCNGRMYAHLQNGNQKLGKNKHFTNKINKIRRVTGSDPFIIKVNEGITEDISFELERELICVIGRHDEKLGPLCNHTDGGEGNKGRIVNEETRKKLSKAQKGKIVSKETLQKMSRSHGITDEVLNKAKFLIDEGMPIHKIAEIVSITHKTLLKHFKNDFTKRLQERKKLTQEKKEYKKTKHKSKYRITYPDGTIVEIHNLSKFSKENGFPKQGLHNLTRGRGNTYKGYKCEKINLDK